MNALWNVRLATSAMKQLALPVFTAVVCFSTPSWAQNTCYDFWLERNQIYKDAGYCFKTARAIRTFGNAGCMYDNERDVPLSAQERRRVNQIVRVERSLGCTR